MDAETNRPESNFSPDFIREQLALAKQAHTFGMGKEEEFSVAAWNNYPAALAEIERLQKIEAASKEYVESLIAWRIWLEKDSGTWDLAESDRLEAAEAMLCKVFGFPTSKAEGK